MSAKRLSVESLNRFIYRQHMLKLQATDVETARGWCMDLIRREHPEMTEAQRERFYEELSSVRLLAVDEWTRRMS